MTPTKLTPSLDWMDAPIESDKWKNLHFSKDGKSYRSINTFDSEAAAKKVFSTHSIEKKWDGWETCDGILCNHEHSHTIQIPWKD